MEEKQSEEEKREMTDEELVALTNRVNEIWRDSNRLAAVIVVLSQQDCDPLTTFVALRLLQDRLKQNPELNQQIEVILPIILAFEESRRTGRSISILGDALRVGPPKEEETGK